MHSKINPILIPLIITVFLISGSLDFSYGQASSNSADNIFYLPIIAHNPTDWIGPYGGTIVNILINPSDPNIVYAGSYGSGVYKSANGGVSWFYASEGLSNLYINSMAIDPSHPSTLYAGTYRSQIFKSEDGGNSWKWSGSGIQNQAIVYSIAVDPNSSNIIYAATRGISNNGSAPWKGVVYKSTNAGSSWYPSLKDLSGPEIQDWVYSIAVNPHAHNQVLIAAHESGPFRSEDFGQTWYPIQNGIQDNSGRSIVISPQPESASTYFYGVWHVDSIYKTTNAASSWFTINQGIPYQHVYSIALDPSNTNNIFLSTFVSGVVKSMNGGSSWLPGGLSTDHILQVAISTDDTSHLLAGTSGDGVFQSDNSGTTWQRTNTGINNAMVTSVVLSPDDPETLYASLYGGGVYQSIDQGQNWVEINLGLSDLFLWDLVMDPANPALLYALTNEGGLFKNDVTNAEGWIAAGLGLPFTHQLMPAYPLDHPFATLEMKETYDDQLETSSTNTLVHAILLKMVYAPSNPKVAYIATGGSGVYRSIDGGQSWQPAGLANQTINTLAVDQSDSNTVYAATSTPGSMWYSTNGGSNWTSVSLPVTFYALATSPLESGVVYAGTSQGVYRYNGSGWTTLGLSDHSITAIKLNPSQAGLIYSGTDMGAYYSLDGGATWKFADENLNSQIIDSISVDPFQSNLLYFGTKTHGIYQVAIHF